MSTLLLRLAGPMQSWGVDSQYDIRFTGRDPSKSGVIGLLCAALGKPRQEAVGDGFPPLGELAAMRMGVRVDRPGRVERDYQTVGGSHRRGEHYGVALAGGGIGSTVVSPRYYLADANFLVGLEGEEVFLERLQRALQAPVWPLFLGRKSCVPGLPVWLPDEPPLGPAFRPASLEDVLAAYPWHDDGRNEARPESLRLVIETESGEATEVRPDVPLSFAERRFTSRAVKTRFIETPVGGV
ncbi:MAG: type I-E CRISPR-associated protein Cas5/CasD [Thermomicrobiales bacterium]